MSSCVAVVDLKPFTLILIGLFIQYWISFFISQTKKQSKSETITKSKTERKLCPSISITRLFKTILLLWQIISIIFVFALDIMHLVKYLDNDKSKIGWQGWLNYNCYAQTVLNSSNLKRVISVFSFDSLDDDEEEEDEMAVQTQIEITSIEPTRDTQETEGAGDALSVMDQENVNRPIQIPNRTMLNQQLKKVLRWLVKLYFASAGPCLLTHYVSGMVCYCWIGVIIFVGITLYFAIIYVLERFTCCKNKWLIPFGGNLLSTFPYNGGKWDSWNGPVVFVGFYFFFVIVMLSMSYWYTGQSYITSIGTVMTERKIVDYMLIMQESFVNKYRFIVTLV
eukprot:271489_1